MLKLGCEKSDLPFSQLAITFQRVVLEGWPVGLLEARLLEVRLEALPLPVVRQVEPQGG